jgi:hypothetical protein
LYRLRIGADAGYTPRSVTVYRIAAAARVVVGAHLRIRYHQAHIHCAMNPGREPRQEGIVMIYEARTYQLKIRAIPEFLEVFGKAYPERARVSPLSGFFYTDIGPLNEVVHLWPYKNVAEREKKRAAAVNDPAVKWPPKAGHLIESMVSEIFIPAPFTPIMAKGDKGPIFEWREYEILPGMMPEVYKNWEPKLAKRLELSPLVMAMHSEIGGLNKFVHIWAYKSLDQRAAVRAEAVAKGIWPPRGRQETLRSQKSKILLAAPFSPLR